MDLPALAEPQNEYTIEIASFANLDSAAAFANLVSKKVVITVTVERSGNSYIVRAGSSGIKGALVSNLSTLKESGFRDATIVSLPKSERHVVLEIPSGRSADTAPENNRNSNVLTLSREQHSSDVRSVSPNQESIEQSPGSDTVSESKSGQTNLMDVLRKEQLGTGRVTSSEEITDVVSFDEARQYLDRGWRGYKAGMCSEALNYFKEAEKNADTLSEARLGLAYCYIKLDRKADAAALLELIVGQNYQIKETLPSLLNLLIEMKDYDKAALYILALGEGEREEWRKIIEERKSRRQEQPLISRQFARAKKTHNTEALIGFVNDYKNRLDRCNDPWIFYDAANILDKSGRKEEARRIYYSLLSACADDWDLRIAAFYGLKSNSVYSEIKPLIGEEMKRAGLLPKYKEQLSELYLNVLKERLSVALDDTAQAEELADEILAIDPQDPDALLTKAWKYYNAKNYWEAYEIFSYLHEQHPANDDSTLGLIYVLIALNEEDKALGLLRESDLEQAEKNKIESQIYLKIGNRLYEQKDYAGSERMLERVLSIAPENKDAQTLLAWTLYGKGEYDRALDIFLSVYESEKEAKIAEAILNTYEKLGRRNDAIRFSYVAGKGGGKDFREVSGSYFASHNMFLTAAQINPDSDAPYSNSDKLYFEFRPWFGHKTGDSGISELSVFSLSAGFSYPFKWGNDVRFSFTTQWLYSGRTPEAPFVGTAPKGNPQIRSLINSLWVLTPNISFEKEGVINLDIEVGTTPLNGPVYPLPTLTFEMKQDRWRINLHQYPVMESILSYTGLKDPYGGREWGRVLQTGAEAELNIIPSSPYWLTLLAGYDYYWGDNVKGNNAINGTVSAGKTFSRNVLDYSLGLFFTTQHFERNSNFFTFGHGGYFSPDVFLMAGPTLGIKTKPYKSYYLNAEAAVGYLYFRTEDSPFLPLGGKDSVGEFKGESTSRIGYDFNIEALKLLTHHTALGVFGDVNQSADFTEWSAGITFRYYVSPRTGFVSSKSDNPR